MPAWPDWCSPACKNSGSHSCCGVSCGTQVIVPEKRLIVSEKAVLLDELAKQLQVRSGCRLHLVVHELPAGHCRSMHTLDECTPPTCHFRPHNGCAAGRCGGGRGGRHHGLGLLCGVPHRCTGQPLRGSGGVLVARPHPLVHDRGSVAVVCAASQPPPANISHALLPPAHVQSTASRARALRLCCPCASCPMPGCGVRGLGSSCGQSGPPCWSRAAASRSSGSTVHSRQSSCQRRPNLLV